MYDSSGCISASSLEWDLDEQEVKKKQVGRSEFGCDRRKICHGRVSGTQDARRICKCVVLRACWDADGVMRRGMIELLGYERRVERCSACRTSQQSFLITWAVLSSSNRD